MSSPVNNLEGIQKELKWITVRDDFVERKSNTKTLYKFLVPAGVLVTALVLGTGLFHLFKRNGRKQQLYMRYRVLAQGVTVGIAALGVFHGQLSN